MNKSKDFNKETKTPVTTMQRLIYRIQEEKDPAILKILVALLKEIESKKNKMLKFKY